MKKSLKLKLNSKPKKSPKPEAKLKASVASKKTKPKKANVVATYFGGIKKINAQNPIEVHGESDFFGPGTLIAALPT